MSLFGEPSYARTSEGAGRHSSYCRESLHGTKHWSHTHTHKQPQAKANTHIPQRAWLKGRNPQARPHEAMCQAVSYTYPNCGHLIAARHVWVPERCSRAAASGFDCWIPRNMPLSRVQRRKWSGQELPPCAMCQARKAYVTRTKGDEGKERPDTARQNINGA